MTNPTCGSVFRLLVGRKQNGAIDRPYLVGRAYYVEGENYYLLKLAMFPERTLVLKKTGRTHASYTVFADCVEGFPTKRFREAVGFARLPPDMKTHLEIRLPLIGRTLFMDLFPFREEE